MERAVARRVRVGAWAASHVGAAARGWAGAPTTRAVALLVVLATVGCGGEEPASPGRDGRTPDEGVASPSDDGRDAAAPAGDSTGAPPADGGRGEAMPAGRGPGAADGPPAVPFTDVTAEAGLAIVLPHPARGDKLLPETMGGGCAFLDHDGDGDQDVLLVGSTYWPDDPRAEDPPPSLALLANDGTGRFEDVTARAGLDLALHGMGVAVADEDADGDLDLFVTALGSDRLLRNEGGIFVDVTESAGVGGAPDAWSTAAAFLDHDRDGDLDLLVAHYVQWSLERDLAMESAVEGLDRAYAPPTRFGGTLPSLFRNEGDGTYTDVTREAGLAVVDRAGQPVAKALGLVADDVDRDGDVDVFVANDTVRNLFLRNRGDGTFTEEALAAGLAYDFNGKPTGAMGVDVGPLLGPDVTCLAVGNFADETTGVYVSRDGFFSEESVDLGLGPETRPAVTFGLVLFDADLDGRLDLLQVNGDLDPEIGTVPGGRRYRQSAQLFWNAGPGATPRLLAVDETGDLAEPLVGRGAAFADVDADGDLDVLVTSVGEAPRLFRNDQQSGHHWLRVTVAGDGGNTGGLGATVTLEAGGRVQRRTVRPTRSYLSQVEPTVTFGLGAADTVKRLRVAWPDGTVLDVAPPEVDRALVVRKPPGLGAFARLMNLTAAHLENGDTRAALAAGERALAADPASAAARRNLARAHLAQGSPERAVPLLEEALVLEPDAVATIYLLGVARARLADFEQAARRLEEAARLDPHTAAIRFQLAGAYAELQRDEAAGVQLEETVRLDPAHGAAWFRLAMRARKAGDTQTFQSCNREFLRLKQLYGDRYQTPLSLEACVHTKAEAAAPPKGGPRAPPARLEVSYTAEPSAPLALDAPPVDALAVLDMDDAGRYTLLAAGRDGRLFLATPSPGGASRWQPVDLALPDLGRVHALRVGNMHDEVPRGTPREDLGARLADVVVLGTSGTVLLQRTAPARFRDVTAASGLAGEEAVAAAGSTGWTSPPGGGADGLFDFGGGPGARAPSDATGAPAPAASCAVWVDAEHDGDLDLLLGRTGPLELWQNNGGGTFAEVAEDLGVPPLAGVVAAAAADLHDDDAIDLVLARGTAPSVVVENQRAGRFRRLPEPPGPWPAARRVLLDDLDNDGAVDAVLVSDDRVALVLGRVPGPAWELGDLAVADVARVDYDNDGWLDLCLVGRRASAPGEGALLVLRNGGSAPWTDVTSDLVPGGAPGGPLRQVVPLDLDTDGDTDLALVGEDGTLRVLSNQGGDGHRRLQLRLASMMHPAGGLGTRVTARAGSFAVHRWIDRDVPIEIGVGDHDRLDSVQTVWTSGVVHDLVDVRPGEAPLDVTVTTVADTGSCPFLYAWDGERVRFVADLIGSGALGLPVARDVFYPVNPLETVIVGRAGNVRPRDGAYTLVITSELREVAYLDRLELVAVDHRPEFEIGSTDMLQVPPFRPSALWGLARLRAPRSAVGDDGIDRTAAVAARDGVHAPPGPVRPPPLRGACWPMTLELDFGALPTDRPLVLALTGWIEYGTASTDIALSQVASFEPIWPRLEARDGSGRWVALDVTTGLPAGKAKTVLVDLEGALPEGADRLRLTTTYELSWDRIALAERVTIEPSAVHRRGFATATLGWRGFSDLRVRSPGAPKTPDFDVVRPRPAWDTAVSGWCTAYGPVGELLAERDGRLVVLNAGDALTLTVPAGALPPLPDGLVRTFALTTVGWNREGDVNTAGGDAVWPLPVDTSHGRSVEAEDAWRLRHNTRWVPPRPWAAGR